MLPDVERGKPDSPQLFSQRILIVKPKKGDPGEWPPNFGRAWAARSPTLPRLPWSAGAWNKTIGATLTNAVESSEPPASRGKSEGSQGEPNDPVKNKSPLNPDRHVARFGLCGTGAGLYTDSQ